MLSFKQPTPTEANILKFFVAYLKMQLICNNVLFYNGNDKIFFDKIK